MEKTNSVRILPPFLPGLLISYRAWWKELTPFQKIFPAAAIVLYWAGLFALHGFRNDHLVTGICILFLSYSGGLSRKFLEFALPFFLTGMFMIANDSTRTGFVVQFM